MGARYSIYDAKAKLSEIIRTVKRNRSVVITERGREVARVVPVERAQTLEERIADLTAQGVIVPAKADHRVGLGPIAQRRGAVARLHADREERDEGLRRHVGPGRRRS